MARLPAPDSVATIAGVLIGSLLYRVLSRQAPPTADDADLVVRLVLAGTGGGPGSAVVGLELQVDRVGGCLGGAGGGGLADDDAEVR